MRERLYKRGRVWWTWYYDRHGRQVKVSTKCRDKPAAASRARELERSALEPGYAARKAATVADAIRLLGTHCDDSVSAGDMRPATATFYAQKVGHWRRVLGAEYPLTDISSGDADRYISVRRGEGATDHTISKELVALRIALKLAKRAGVWAGDIGAILPVGFSARYEPRTRFLSRAELDELLRRLSPRRAAQVAFIVATGAEWSVATKVCWADVAEDLSTVHLRGTKRKTRDRVVPILTEDQRRLLAYALDRVPTRKDHGDKPLFEPWLKVHQDLGRACAAREKRFVKRTGRTNDARPALAYCTPNDLRRTYATWMRAQGAPLDLLAPTMGHATTVMLQRVYARLSTEDLAARMRAAMGLPDCTSIVPNRTGKSRTRSTQSTAR